MEAIKAWLDGFQPGQPPPAQFYNIYVSQAQPGDARSAQAAEDSEYRLSLAGPYQPSNGQNQGLADGGQPTAGQPPTEQLPVEQQTTEQTSAGQPVGQPVGQLPGEYYPGEQRPPAQLYPEQETVRQQSEIPVYDTQEASYPASNPYGSGEQSSSGSGSGYDTANGLPVTGQSTEYGYSGPASSQYSPNQPSGSLPLSGTDTYQKGGRFISPGDLAEVDVVVKLIVTQSDQFNSPGGLSASTGDVQFRGIDSQGTAKWIWKGTERGAQCTNFGLLKQHLDGQNHKWDQYSHNLLPAMEGLCRVDDPRSTNRYEFIWSTSLEQGEWRKSGATWKSGQKQTKELPVRSLNGKQLELYPAGASLTLGGQYSGAPSIHTIKMPPQARAIMPQLGLLR